jgi:acid phosphatase
MTQQELASTAFPTLSASQIQDIARCTGASLERSNPALRTAVMLLLCLASTAGVASGAGVPRPDHVLIVIEENHSYSEVIGVGAAPYINSLAAGGALMTQSFALTHPSQPNYVAFFSGSTQGVTTDSVYPHSQFTAPDLGAKLLYAGFTFGGYSETMPSVGYDGASAGTAPATYQRKHNPWVNWQDTTVPLPVNKLPLSVNMPYAGYFPTSANYASLPALCFVIPNQLDDMHDGTVAQGDAWLQANLSAYANWCLSHNSLLIVTWDEDDSSSGNHIATIFYGPMVVTGQYGETINHYSVLRTLEDMFALPHDAGSATATSITDIWVQTSPGISFCDPGVNGVAACPCANPPSGPSRGCDNSSSTGGAQLSSAGTASLTTDTVVLTASGEKPTATSVFLQGDAAVHGGSVFGQGVRCAGGSLKRLYVKTASAGVATAPQAGDASVSARSSELGDTIASGATRYYGVYYRDPIVLGACPATSTFNITQSESVLWGP